jgi:glycosyltransferase involved in cell wall biosynthesis
LLRDETDTRFVIVGEGVKKHALQQVAQKKGLGNVVFLPYQPREAFAEMLAAADLSLVTLNRSSSLSSLPSKAFNIMASARPILAVAPPDSEIAQLVRENGCGLNVPTEQPEQLAETIMDLRHQTVQLLEMGQNGRTVLETRFSRAHCADLHERMLMTLL